MKTGSPLSSAKSKRIKMQKIYSAVFMMFLACAAFTAMPVQNAVAQSFDVNKIPPMPEFDMSDADFIAKTKLYEETPYGDKYLSYTLRLPTDWKKLETEGSSQSIDTSKSLLGEVGKFFGPPSLQARSSFIIQATELGYEITAKNWFLNYVLSRGYTLQGMKVVSDRRIEALYVLVEKDTSYVVRAAGEINGSRMVLAMYYIPEGEWEAQKAVQAKSVASFKFLSPEKAKVESTRTYAFLDLLKFDYPSSWRLQAPNIYSTESMSAKIVNSPDDTVLNGQIDVHVVSTELDTTLPEEIKNVQKALNDKGLVIGKLIEQPKDFKSRDHVYFSRIEVYQANDKNKTLVDYEYWIGVLIENRYYYIVTMLTPARQTEFYGWARNSEAFRTVVESMRIN
jgi:hypothetical protein